MFFENSASSWVAQAQGRNRSTEATRVRIETAESSDAPLAEDAERYRDLALFHPRALKARPHWSESAIGAPGRISFAFRIDESDTGPVLRCPSVPEVAVDGGDREELIEAAGGIIGAAVDRRISAGIDVPIPEPGEPRVELALATSLRLALHWALREEGASASGMVSMLGWPAERGSALLAPGATVPCDDLDEALAYLGLRLSFALEPL